MQLVSDTSERPSARAHFAAEDFLAGVFAPSGAPLDVLARVARAIERAGERLGVTLQGRAVGSGRLFASRVDDGTTFASGEALRGTRFESSWLAGELEDRRAAAALSGRSEREGDAAAVAAALSRFGPRALADVYGDYAIVAVERSGRVLAAVTPGGRAKLYCATRDGVFAWATHPALLLEESAACDPVYFQRQLGSLFTGERTPFVGVTRVPGGHFVACDRGASTARIERWWSPPVGTLRHRDARDYEAHLRDALTDAVARASRGHRTIAVSLSAGIDSASIAVCGAKLVRRGEIERVVGVSLSTPDEPLSDECPLARELARRIGVDFAVASSARVASFDEACLNAARSAFPRQQTLGPWHRSVAETARAAGATVLLNGVGGETLASELDSLWTDPRPIGARDVASAAGALAHLGPRLVLKTLIMHARLRQQTLTPGVIAGRRPWVRPAHADILEPSPLDRVVRLADNLVAMDPDITETTDRVYVAPIGLARRAPYRDRRVLELAYALPLWARMHRTSDLRPKTLARRAFPEVPLELSAKASRLSLNHSVAQAWSAIFDPAVLVGLVRRLPASLDAAIDREAAARAVAQLADAERIIEVADLFATGVWAEGMRRLGFSLS